MIQISHRTKIGILFVITGISIIVAILADSIPQATTYHNFSDQRMLHGIPNFWNVLSSLTFALFGFAGLYKINMSFKISAPEINRNAYTLFFSGAMFVTVGSSWYHLNPTNSSLFWDRLPMTVAFMALFSIIIAEFVSKKAGKLLLMPLIIFGMLSVTYWYLGEQQGVGDLRLYVLVQFLPMILIPTILVLFKSNESAGIYPTIYLWAMLACYVFSKVAEHFDAEIFDVLSWISGHSIKHLLASLAVLFFYIRTLHRIR